jgi:mannobiose 2-epimerase
LRGAIKRLGAPVRALTHAREAWQARRPPPYVPAPEERAHVRALLERMLLENIVPFWERTIDREFGGYRFNHDSQGAWIGPGWKTTANQARMLCYYALLNRSPHRTPASLEAARHGVDILAGPLWHDRHGGFFWAVDHTTRKVLVPEKHVLAQAYGLYALSEHCRAVSDPRALGLAQQAFDVIVTKMKDRRYGGYLEGFSRSWRPQSVFRRNAMAKGPHVKSMSAHMNLMSAMNHFYRVTGATDVRHELHELVLIQSNAVASKQVATSSSHFLEDWQATDPDHVSAPYFDHDLKNIWQLISACDALEIPAWVLGGLFRAQFAAAVRVGHDPVHGGFFTPPRFKRPGAPREKDWWTQAEGLVSALHLYVLFEEEEYWRHFRSTLDWIDRCQVDWNHGDWHAYVTESGIQHGNKAGRWKTAYHSGRAVLTCLELLR